MRNAIELCGVEKRLGNFQLGPMDMKVPEGAIVGYIGENGAGKSTTIKLLLGLMEVDQGEVRVLGKNLAQLPPQDKHEIAFVFDDLFLPGDLNLKQLNTFHQGVYGQAWESGTFFDYVKRFHLPESKAIKNYSRGMKMQLGLALQLSHGANLLLLDEATSGLDPVIRDDVLDLLLDFREDPRHTILISSHILSDIEKAADYIAFIHQGKLLFMDEKDALIERYGMASLSREQLSALDPDAIVGKRTHQFGADVLVRRDLVSTSLPLEKVRIEDIMVYMIKGDRA